MDRSEIVTKQDEPAGSSRSAYTNLGRGELLAVDEALRPYLAAYRRDFLEAFHPRFLAVEAMVCSERYAYGGTADAFVEIAGEIWLLDARSRDRFQFL